MGKFEVYTTLELKSAETMVKEKTKFRSEMNPTKLESKTANRLGKKAHEYNGVYTRLDSYGHDTNLNFKQSTHKNRNTVRLGFFFFFFFPAGNL